MWLGSVKNCWTREPGKRSGPRPPLAEMAFRMYPERFSFFKETKKVFVENKYRSFFFFSLRNISSSDGRSEGNCSRLKKNHKNGETAGGGEPEGSSRTREIVA